MLSITSLVHRISDWAISIISIIIIREDSCLINLYVHFRSIICMSRTVRGTDVFHLEMRLVLKAMRSEFRVFVPLICSNPSKVISSANFSHICSLYEANKTNKNIELNKIGIKDVAGVDK